MNLLKEKEKIPADLLNGTTQEYYVACITQPTRALLLIINLIEITIPDWERFKASGKFKQEFTINSFNEFDWVEILYEKDEYAKKGLHKGMLANVLFDYAIDDNLSVMFPDDDGYDVEVSVNIEDIKLHRRI